mgnify:FL=1
MNLRNEIALMYRGDSKEFFHNNILIKVIFDYTGTFAIDVCDPETKDIITHYSSSSLKECIEFLERF